ncbi:MAG TPA: IS1595 family transposase [Acidobacteriaceae bacterium]
MKTLLEIIRHFSDEQTCINTVSRLRWMDGKPTCPRCAGQDVLWLQNQRRWKCRLKNCKKQFFVKVGTIFQDCPLSLDKWLVAMWLICNCKNGVSSYEIARDLGITQKSAWHMMHRIREAMRDNSLLLSGTIEMDETFIGGKIKNMHKSKRPVGPGFSGKAVAGTAKTIVVGMLERSGRVRAQVVQDRTRTTLHAIAHANIASGSELITDEHHPYKGVDFRHRIINHAETYVQGRIHTNGIENFWSLLKRGLGGTYVSVEPFHLFRYIDEQAFGITTVRIGTMKSGQLRFSLRSRASG